MVARPEPHPQRLRAVSRWPGRGYGYATRPKISSEKSRRSDSTTLASGGGAGGQILIYTRTLEALQRCGFRMISGNF